MRSLTVRDAMLIWLPLALLVALAAWFVAAFVEPAPPKRVVMSTGPLDGAYHAFALRYKAHLAEYGITLELKPSAGAAENIERLKSRQDGVTLALVQGGLANAENAPGLVTLGSMFYEPGWFFYRGGKESDLGNPLRGKRIAIGPSGSGTRAIGLQVMHHAGLAEPPTVLSELGGMAAAKALEAGEVDVVFYVAAADAPGVQRLLAAPACGCSAQSAPRPSRGACLTCTGSSCPKARRTSRATFRPGISTCWPSRRTWSRWRRSTPWLST
ncbi:MAG: ABC transporter substrate-binding protein [Betaproteobacteria bacterium]|nr:ABC transporter substrate-binding protein [Betaproteobacteria bacterium]